jgi:two-component system NtrC family sensor kinase
MTTIDAGSTQSNTLLHQVMQRLVEGVAITDKHGQLVYVNPALEGLLGYNPGELIGHPCSELFGENLRQHLVGWQSGDRREDVRRYEANLRRKDGSTVPVLASSCPLFDGGHNEAVLSTFTDLQDSSQLPPGAEGLGSPPTIVNPQMASIIHELSNSLTILFLQAQWLSRKGSLAAPVDDKLAVIRDQAKRMIQMVDDLRATADPTHVRLEAIDINGLIERTLELQQEQLQSAEIQVSTDLEASLPACRADPYKLQQVLVNVINNACQAMASTDQAGKLAIRTQSVVSAREDAPRIQIRIADCGPGISPQAMPHIFEPFFTTKRANGMGLGLSICDQIVRNHGGTIWAESNAGGGATFVVDLPAANPPPRTGAPLAKRPPAEAHPAATPHVRTSRHHILVVDDEASVAWSMGEVLHQAGFQVSTTTEARQALALVDENHIDLIVSDMSMPHMSGAQFWQAVKERNPCLASRIIFSTGDNGSLRAQAFLRFSGCAVLQKPFEPQELVRLVRANLPNGAPPRGQA